MEEQKKKHIKHYAKALKLAKDYHKKWRNEEFKKWPEETDEQFKKRYDDYLKSCDKSEKDALKRLENADKAEGVKEIEAEVTWTGRPGVMGYQCRAKVWVSCESWTSFVEGPRTNGWGYDKASTALSEAFGKLDGKGLGALDKMVIEAGPKVWAEYAIETRPFPHFEFGGKGMSTFLGMFHRLGFKRYKDTKFAFPKFEIEYRQNSDEDYFIHVIRKDLI